MDYRKIQYEMHTNEVIETIGSITKMENLCTTVQDVLDNTLVFKNSDPFPGYQAGNKESLAGRKQGSSFIILRYRYAPEKINLINRDLARKNIAQSYPSYGEIITRESILPCIRIKNIENKPSIADVQKFLMENELQLMPFKYFEGPARIKIFKTFKLVEIGEGIYRDLDEGEKIYIRIPVSLNWKRFDFIIKKIKYNLNDRNFDAALGIIYRFCGPEDVIRIYDQQKTLERAMQLKNLFVKECKKEALSSPTHYHLPE